MISIYISAGIILLLIMCTLSFIMGAKIHKQKIDNERQDELFTSRKLPLEYLPLPKSVESCLKQEGVLFLGYFERYTKKDLLKIKEVGKRWADRIEIMLEAKGIFFRSES